MNMKPSIATVLAGLGCFAASQTYAGTITDVMAPATGEPTHAEIFDNLFGGAPFVANGVNFSNGVVDVTRVDDDDDQSYAFLNFEAHALAVYGDAAQGFGTASDGQLFQATGSGDETGGQILGVPGSNDIKFVRFPIGSTDTTTASTDPSANVGGNDHVVTYTWSVNGVPVENSYLLFFEDLDENVELADFDYNDLVVEVSGVVPEPSAMALIALGGLAVLRRRR